MSLWYRWPEVWVRLEAKPGPLRLLDEGKSLSAWQKAYRDTPCSVRHREVLIGTQPPAVSC